MRLFTIVSILFLSAAGFARADSAPAPMDLEVKQVGSDVHIRASMCDECMPWYYEILRVGDDTVLVGEVSFDEGEVLDSWSTTWENWNRVELVDQCVPVELGGTEYTYQFTKSYDGGIDIHDSIHIDVDYRRPCDGSTDGCAASISGSRTVAALPMALGLALVLVGAVTLRVSRRLS